MTVGLWEHLPHTIGARRWIGRVLDAVAESRSVIAVFPANVDHRPLWEAVRVELWQRREARIVELMLAEFPRAKNAVSALTGALGVTDPAFLQTIEGLLAVPDLPDIIAVHDIDQLERSSRLEWIQLFWQLARHAGRTSGGAVVPVVVCFLKGPDALEDLPGGEVRVAVEWWWSIPSVIELRVLCRLGSGDGAEPCRETWREHLLPSISGSDLSLLQHLWNDPVPDLDDLFGRLIAYAERHGWTHDALSRAGAEMAVGSLRVVGHVTAYQPPEAYRQLWAWGALGHTEEYGTELSSAALALLGHRQAVAHRVWRGQAGLLLPMLDAVRLQVCGFLSERYGMDWPKRFAPPGAREEAVAVADDPYSAQWGYLLQVFRSARGLQTEPARLSLVEQCWWIRNELAHYRPLAYAVFQRFWQTAAGGVF